MSAFTDDDVTGWCERGNHAVCDGTLHTKTGFHWWCRCSCHPEPSKNSPDERKAHAVWKGES
jgi:hypothetical protein